MAVNRIEIEISASAEKARAGLREVSAEVVRATKEIDEKSRAAFRGVESAAAQAREGTSKVFTSIREDYRRNVALGVTEETRNLVRTASSGWNEMAETAEEANERTQKSSEKATRSILRDLEQRRGQATAQIDRIHKESAASLSAALQGARVGLLEFTAQAADFSAAGANAMIGTFGAMQKGLSQVFFDVVTLQFDDLGASFEGLGKRILGIWLDLIAQMVVAWLTSPIASFFGGQPVSFGQAPTVAGALSSAGVTIAQPGFFDRPIGSFFGGSEAINTPGAEHLGVFGNLGGPLGGFGNVTVRDVLGTGAIGLGAALTGLAAAKGDKAETGLRIASTAIAGGLAFDSLGGLAAGAGVGLLGAGLGFLFGGGERRPTFLSDELSPQAFGDAAEIFRSRGFDEGTAQLLAARAANAVENTGEGRFTGSKKNIDDLRRNFTSEVNQVLREQFGPGFAPFSPAGRTVFAQRGFSGIVERPTGFVAGEAGPERVRVEPIGRGGRDAGGDVTIHIDLRGSVVTSRREIDLLARRIEASIRRNARLRHAV